jgi:hypothetical protein
LNEDRDLPADAGVADFDRGCFSALDLRHGFSLPAAECAVQCGSGWGPDVARTECGLPCLRVETWGTHRMFIKCKFVHIGASLFKRG